MGATLPDQQQHWWPMAAQQGMALVPNDKGGDSGLNWGSD